MFGQYCNPHSACEPPRECSVNSASRPSPLPGYPCGPLRAAPSGGARFARYRGVRQAFFVTGTAGIIGTKVGDVELPRFGG